MINGLSMAIAAVKNYVMTRLSFINNSRVTDLSDTRVTSTGDIRTTREIS